MPVTAQLRRMVSDMFCDVICSSRFPLSGTSYTVSGVHCAGLVVGVELVMSDFVGSLAFAGRSISETLLIANVELKNAHPASDEHEATRVHSRATRGGEVPATSNSILEFAVVWFRRRCRFCVNSQAAEGGGTESVELNHRRFSGPKRCSLTEEGLQCGTQGVQDWRNRFVAETRSEVPLDLTRWRLVAWCGWDLCTLALAQTIFWSVD